MKTLNELLIESFREKLIQEGVYDPGIFKCVFMAGGPGSGKSYVASNLFNLPSDSSMSSYGLKLVSSDFNFEKILKKLEIPLDFKNLQPKDFHNLTLSPDSPRAKAKDITQKKFDFYKMGRLGVIIDGTGRDFDNIKRIKNQMEQLGYDCYAVFVDTSLETALDRNSNRPRRLPDDVVTDLWNQSNKNKEKFKSLFGNNCIIINNDNVPAADSSINKFVNNIVVRPVRNTVGQQWIKNTMVAYNRSK